MDAQLLGHAGLATMLCHSNWTPGDVETLCADLSITSLPCSVFQCRVWLSTAGRQVPWSSAEPGGSGTSRGGTFPTKVPSRTPGPWETRLAAKNQESEEKMLLVDLSSLGPPLAFTSCSLWWGLTVPKAYAPPLQRPQPGALDLGNKTAWAGAAQLDTRAPASPVCMPLLTKDFMDTVWLLAEFSITRGQAGLLAPSSP